MLQRPVAWVSENRLLAAGVALIVVASVVSLALVSGGGDGISSTLTEPGTTMLADEPPAEDAESDETRAGGGASPTERRGDSVAVGGGEVGEVPPVPGLRREKGAAPCVPEAVEGTGITDETITIGQIITDSNQIPQQFKPAREGLQAFVELVNANGGICDRELRLEVRNDNLNPATHRSDYQELAGKVFAFVGNESLLDNLDYEQDPPFDPTFTDGGEPVPDVGGLAFSYNRSQSPWHAGVVGSVSPVLVGGGQYRYFQQEAKRNGTPCKQGGVVYLREPTGASEDQARLGQVSLEEDWGADLGEGNTELYAANLVDPVPAYEVLVDRMVADGMNCAFAYTDLQSSINLVLAMRNRGVWPPAACDLGDRCFRVVYIPLSAHDPKFIQDAGDAALGVSTFIPHIPLTELDHPAMQLYTTALEAVPNARPSTFSILGFASGQMLVEGLRGCLAAPTRDCLMKGLRDMKGFTAAGLLGGTTPFRTTRATFGEYGTLDWKWIFNHTVALRVADRGGKRDFYRINPERGFFEDTLKVARGTPAS